MSRNTAVWSSASATRTASRSGSCRDSRMLLPFAASVLAGAIAAVSGFGIGSLLTPLLVLAIPLPTAQAVAVLAVPHALATAIRFSRLRRDVHRPTFREFGIASAIGGLAGAALQSQ